MAQLLLNLRHVPDDEADGVRTLLDEHGIAYYETPPNRWGISAGGIWITDDTAIVGARELMAVFQSQRQQTARETYAQAVRDGSAPTFWTVLREQPLKVLAVALGIAIIVGVCALPFVLLGR